MGLEFLKDAMSIAQPLMAFGSELYSGITNASAQQVANDTNVALARENREWQQKMSDTAHSREVADLKNAGLNPILSATKGLGGSSTPSGSVASVDPVKSALTGFSSVFQTLASTQQAMAQAELIRAEENITRKYKPDNVRADTTSKIGSAEQSQAQAKLAKESTEALRITNALGLPALTYKMKLVENQINLYKRDLAKIDIKISQEELNVIKREATRALNEQKIDKTDFGKLMTFVDRLLKPLAPAIPLIRQRR